jgi:hypothetical protein
MVPKTEAGFIPATSAGMKEIGVPRGAFTSTPVAEKDKSSS